MPYQNIEAVLSDADLAEIKTAIATIQSKMPFLVSLSIDERKRLYKMGDKRLAFVHNSLNAARNNRGILPTSFDFEGYAKDCELARNLNDVMMALNQVTEQVDDTLGWRNKKYRRGDRFVPEAFKFLSFALALDPALSFD